MKIEERLSFFDENYEMIAEYELDKGKKLYIGKNDKICRFCGRREPEVTFKNDAHAVPQFLGNKQLILKNECDICNTFVSNNLENHLDKYTKPYRAIAQIKGDTKVPSYKSKDKRSRYDVNYVFDDKKITRIINPVDSNFASIDIENCEIKTNFHLEPYIPTAVYKCLVKIALSIIPDEELKAFTLALRWIMEEDHSLTKICEPQLLIKTFIPGFKPNKKLKVFILRGKSGTAILPYCIFVMWFGNMAYQIIVPSDIDLYISNIKGTLNMNLVRFPLPFEINCSVGGIEYSQDNMTSHEPVTNGSLPMTFGFDEVIKVDPNSIKL